MAGGMTAGRGPQRGQPTATTAAGRVLLGRAGPPGVEGAGSRGVPSGPSAPPPVEEEGPAPDARVPTASPAEVRRTQRHCWVLPGEDDGLDEPLAGVVAEWRSTPTGWLGRVVYALGDDETATVVESWLTAEQLRPA
ncbi:hypothetical protein WDZ17_01155 [Pseudokineococcus basanitobsidens]|uniref:Uncharacterized protein n=1 Tax=Pseudokineococcus basanitobsidens TaxID=1926649 RepID=A0ABU8RFR0_9ACTN